MNLVGFLNRSRAFPSPLIAIGREGTDFFAFYPSGDRIKLLNVISEESIRSRDTFISGPSDAVTEIPDLAFGVKSSTLVCGDKGYVGRVLRGCLWTGVGELLPDEKDAIRTFLLSVGEFVGAINAKELREILNDRAKLNLYVEDRKLRRSNEKAKTLLVQLKGGNGTKTLYRKGFSSGCALTDVRIPGPVATFFQHVEFKRTLLSSGASVKSGRKMLRC